MTDDRTAPLGLFVLRAALGVMYVAHGLLKVLVFTPAGFAGFLAKTGNPELLAWPIIIAEIVGGAALILGLYARHVAAALLPILIGGHSDAAFKRAAQHDITEHLRRLRLPQAVAWHGGGDVTMIIGALERVGDGDRQQPAHFVVGQFAHQFVDVPGRQTGARGVMHQHPVIRGEPGLFQCV